MAETIDSKKPQAKELDVDSLTKMMQGAFYTLIAFTVGGLIPFTYYGIEYVKMINAKAPEGYPMPKLEDMKIVVASTVLWVIVEESWIWLFKPLCRHLCKTQDTSTPAKYDEQTRRSHKMAKMSVRALYFLGATLWGYYVLKDEYWLPRELGGKGVSYREAFKEFPYGNHPKGMKEYLLWTMGYHTGGLVVHWFEERRGSFVEMALHHIVTFYLYAGMYYYNVWTIGGVIAFLHDIADIFSHVVKFFTETNCTTTTVAAFFANMLVWFYTRNLILPCYIYIIATEPVTALYEVSGFVKPFFCYLLSIQTLLHYYWFAMFIILLKKYAKSGSTEDSHQGRVRNKKGN